MSQETAAASAEAQDLVITAPRARPRATLWRAWSDPELLKEVVVSQAVDHLRCGPSTCGAGGAFHTFMQGPDGGTSDNPGSFLEVVPQAAGSSSARCCSQAGGRATPWMAFTAIITMADEGEGTRYVATVMHPDQATRDRHARDGILRRLEHLHRPAEAFAREHPAATEPTSAPAAIEGAFRGAGRQSSRAVRRCALVAGRRRRGS